MKPELLRWILLTLVMCPLLLFAREPLVLDRTSGPYLLNSHISVFKDSKGSLTINEVAGPTGQQLFERNSIRMADSDMYSSVHWIKAELINPDSKSKELILEVGYPFYDQVELYLFDANGQGLSRKVNANYPVYKRELSSRHFLFQLDIPARQYVTAYLRLKTKGFMPMPIRLWQPEQLLSKLNLEQYVYGLFYGVLALLITYNFLVLVNSWDKIYLYYIASMTCLVAIIMSVDGFAFEFIWRHYPALSDKSLPFFLFAGVIGFSLLSRSFLGTRRNTPVIDYVLIAIMSIAATGAFLSLLLPYDIMVPFGMGIAFVCAVTSLVTGAVSLNREVFSVQYYLMGWMLLVLGIFYFVLQEMGFIPSNFYTEYSAYIGASFGGMIMSLGIADRMRMLERENLLAQSVMETRQKLSDTFEKFVPKQFISRKKAHDFEEISLGNFDSGNITILFSDVRAFTELSELMTPDEVFRFLNSYLSRMEPPIQKHGGFVDKFIGDAIMALFELDSERKSAHSAILAAIDMQRALVLYNKHRRKVSYPPIQTGIGIHSGEVMIGTVGSAERMDFTAIGNAVNISSRLEGLTKYYGARIIVSRDTMDLLEDRDIFKHRILDWLRVKGKKEPVEIYEILENDPAKVQEAKIKAETYIAHGLSYRHQKDFENAVKWFKKGALMFPKDDALKFHYQTCARLLSKKVARNWDGAIDMDQK